VFRDRRSKKVILVAHCLLNQNARIDGCAYFPGAMEEAARSVVDSGVGVLQMPCPELHCLGLDRSGRMRDGIDIGIREALLEGEGQRICRSLVEHVIEDVKEYQKHGFQIVGVVGNDGSPACGVDMTWYVDRGAGPGTGAFMLVLRDELKRRGLDIPFAAVLDEEWAEGTARVRALLEAAAEA
jgi:predicted secreted protein